MLRRLAVISFAALLTLGVVASPAKAGWGVNNQHQIVPLYVYPFWWNTDDDWERACAESNDSNIGSVMIANLDNGPGSFRNTDYAQAIEVCHDLGQNIIGYVDTSYGTVPLVTVKANVDKWFDFYDGNNTGVYNLGDSGVYDSHIDGIFLDQISNFPTDSTVETGVDVGEYYREIFEYIKAEADGDYDQVIGNPGATASTDWQLDDYSYPETQVADELVVFEGTSATFSNYTPEAWIENYPASDIAMMVYDTDQGDIDDVCADLKNNNAGWVTVTDATITQNYTPWNSYPSPSYVSDTRTECG